MKKLIQNAKYHYFIGLLSLLFMGFSYFLTKDTNSIIFFGFLATYSYIFGLSYEVKK
jgi:hypothetical protein